MELKSLGYRTDLFFTSYDGRILDRGSYLVIETPSNPRFHWGNLLIFDRAPVRGDFEQWRELFRREFLHQPLVRHCTLAWDEDARGDVDEFLAAGFKVEESVILATDAVVAPPKVNSDVIVRPLESDDDWEQAFQNQVACRDEVYERVSYEAFKRPQMNRYRRMADEGRGHWFGAFLDGRLVADLGVYVVDGLGRYQSVGTHPDFRRLGICGTLVWKAGLIGFQELGATRLVMAADEHYHAAKIYESVGFRIVERQYGASLPPRDGE